MGSNYTWPRLYKSSGLHLVSGAVEASPSSENFGISQVNEFQVAS